MIRFSPSRDAGDAERSLTTLIKPQLDPLLFAEPIRCLQRVFSTYRAYCPPPWASHGLRITPEISYQSEHWLPLDQLRPHFYSFYRQSLTYPPIYSTTPFAQATSWAAVVAGLPPFLKQCGNPAELLEQLLCDPELRKKFLFWSFMPTRFYGKSSDRYAGQSAMIAEWIRQRSPRGTRLRCLDVASGEGASSYGLSRLLAEQGWTADRFRIEGWTLDPLEAWAAAHGRFPHDPAREQFFRQESADCFERGLASAIRFCCADILNPPTAEPFDLIICNGLLGGPIIHGHRSMAAVVQTLTELLAPGGMLLAADHFHGGWKQKCPQGELRALFDRYGLIPIEAREGVAAVQS